MIMELLNALETESLTKIKALIKSNNIFDDDALSCNILMKAFSYDRKDVIIFLLKNHCYVDSKLKTYSFTTTPLHCAIKMRDISLIEEILKMKPSLGADSDDIDVNLEDSVSDNSISWAGYTALYFAVDFGSLEAFTLLTNIENVKKSANYKKLSLSRMVNQHLEDLLVMSYFLKGSLIPTYTTIDDNSEIYFLLACYRENSSFLKKFIDIKANVNYKYLYFSFKSIITTTGLHIAVLGDHRDTVELLLQHGAKIESTNEKSMTALHLAVYNDHQYYDSEKDSMLNLLYITVKQNLESNVEDKNGLGYFEIAVTRNDVEIVKHFLDKGLDVNKLIKPNSLQFSHFTPLHFAILYQHKDMAELLIKCGANIDLTGNENVYGTPLHLAFVYKNKNLIELLLRSGANVNLVNEYNGKTMLHSALSHIYMHKIKLQQKDFSSLIQTILMYVEQLVNLGIDVNACDKDGNTALHYFHPDFDETVACLQLLLELGADINLEGNYHCLFFDSRRYVKGHCTCKGYLIFYHHVQRLKTLGLEVHPKNDEICKMIEQDLQKLEPSKKAVMAHELACRQQQRVDEIARLKTIMITSYMSLYDFVKLEPRRAAAYIPNNILEHILNDKDFGKTYPSYGYLIRLKYKKNFNYFQANNFLKMSCSEINEESPPKKRQCLE